MLQAYPSPIAERKQVKVAMHWNPNPGRYPGDREHREQIMTSWHLPHHDSIALRASAHVHVIKGFSSRQLEAP